MRKKRNTLIIGLFIIIIFASIGLLYFNNQQKLKQQELERQRVYEALLKEEKQILIEFLSSKQSESIMSIHEFSLNTLALTNRGNVYQFSKHLLKDNRQSYQLLFNDIDLFGEKIVGLDHDTDNKSDMSILTEDNGVFQFHQSYKYDFTEEYPNSTWEKIEFKYKPYGKKTYWNYIDYSKILDDFVFTKFKLLKSNDFSNTQIFLLMIEGNLEMYELSNENSNDGLIKVNGSLDNSVLTNVKEFKTAGMGSRRAIILTEDGHVYGRGLYGAIEQFGQGVLVLKIEDGNSFEKLDLGNAQGKVENFSSNPYFDIFTTTDGTYLYGILPSQIMSGHSSYGITKPFFKELTYKGESVITKSLNCQEYASCFILTINDEILYIGKNRYYTISDDFVQDDLFLIDYTGQLVTNDQINFDKSFSDSGDFIVSKSNDIYYYAYDDDIGNVMYHLDGPEYYLTYEDYLTQRKQEYIDEIDQSIIDEYYESIKSTLPKGNIIN